MSTFDPIQQPLAGSHSIEASAGTGKTHSITLLWLRLLVEEQLTVDQILVTTFTKAATAELKERLLASLRRALEAARLLERNTSQHGNPGAHAGDSPEMQIVRRACGTHAPASLTSLLVNALSAFDLAPISTIHGFCSSLLKRHALEVGCDPDLELAESCDDLLHEIAGDAAMQLADDPATDPGRLGRVAKTIARRPHAEILTVSGDPQAEMETLAAEMIPLFPRLAAEIKHAGSRKALERIFEQFKESRTWEALKEGARQNLTKDFVESWDRYGALLDQVSRQPAARVALDTRNAFAHRKAQAGIQSFDDILIRVAEALSDPEETLARAVRSRLKAAIIDECQDNDGVQIQVFERLFLHKDTRSFLVIGDPKQSIYRFRGADLSSYKQLVSQTSRAPQMGVNHRSDKPLIEALNALYGGNYEFPDSLSVGAPTRYIQVAANAQSARISDPASLPPLNVLWTDADRKQQAQLKIAELVAAECHRLLHGGVQIEDRHRKPEGAQRPLRAGDIAILASGHRELKLMRKYLTRLGIACQSSGNGMGSVFASDEALDVLAWLECLAALQEREAVLARTSAFLGTPLGGWEVDRLRELSNSPSQQAAVCQKFQPQTADLEKSGPLPLLLRHLALPEVIARNLPFAEGERRFTNWRQVASLLQQEHARGRHGARALALWLSRQIAGGTHSQGDEAESDESALMKLETDSDAVQLVTIHNSKGLEYPVVFCPFLWQVRSKQERRKDPTAVFRRTQDWAIDVGSEDFAQHREHAFRQEDEEEHRKLYVALTRPRHRLYIGLAPVGESKGGHDNSASKSPLAKLLQLQDTSLNQWRNALQQHAFLTLHTEPLPAHTAPAAGHARAGGLRKPETAPDYRFPFHRTSSFSNLSKSDRDHFAPADRDEDTAQEQESAPAPDDLLQPLGKAGSLLGDLLHRVLEEVLGNRKEVEEAIAEYALSEPWIGATHTILNTRLELPSLGATSLAEVKDSCITEMQFHLPAGDLSPGRLSEALCEDFRSGQKPDRLAWARQIAGWCFTAFSGFLQGYIDLIFEKDGRWFIADYKSNQLKDYGEPTLESAMLRSHYLLQARLYALALHRHLSVQLEGYDYERHFGGVAYLFVRGFPDSGVWFERTPLSSLEKLGALFPPAAGASQQGPAIHAP